MAPFTQFDDALALGKRLVQQLGTAQDDLLAAWMAHYLAGLMADAQAAPAHLKSKKLRECVEEIFRLWEHRAVALHEERPFAEFDALFFAIERMSPEGKAGLAHFLHGHSPKMRSTEGQRWLDYAIGVDQVATQLVRWCLGEAAQHAADNQDDWRALIEKTKWGGAQLVAVRLVSELIPERKQAQDEGARKTLEAMKDRLGGLEKMAQAIRLEIDRRLEQASPSVGTVGDGPGRKETTATRGKPKPRKHPPS